MKVLVTGAGGFVGGVVADVFARNGVEVLASYRRTQPEHLRVYRNVTLVELDLLQCEEVPEPFDCLIHCAADQPETTLEDDMVLSNIEGTRKLFTATIDAGIRKIIYLSSRAVYGTVQVKVMDEYTPLNESDAYGQSKYQQEKLLHELVSQIPNLSGVTIRLPTMVGVGAHDNFLANIFQKILDDQPIQVTNPEGLFNNIVLAKDLAGFLLKLSESMPTGYTMTNIGSMEPIPICEVIHSLYRYSGRSEQVTYAEGGNTFIVSLEYVRKLGFRPATVRGTLERFVYETLSQII